MREMTTDSITVDLEQGDENGCDPRVAAGLQGFFQELRPTHTLSSRNPSLWALLRRWLDKPVAEFLTDYSKYCRTDMLGDLKPSAMGRRPPVFQPIAELALVDACSPESFQRRTERGLVDRYPKDVAGYEANLSDWEAGLRFAIRSADQSAQTRALQSGGEFAATLDALRYLVRGLKRLRPETVRPLSRREAHVPFEQVGPATARLCELCWRYTERYQAQRTRNDPTFGTPQKQNDRYCVYHVPVGSPDDYHSYRADIRYRDAFHREVAALEWGGVSEYGFRFHPRVPGDEQEIRKAAYDTVHSGIRPLRGQSHYDTGFAEQVWQRYRAGTSQAEIGRLLGAHRSAVCRTLRQLRGVVARHRADGEIHPVTDEPFSLSQESTRLLFEEIRRLRQQGSSTARIASQLGRTQCTVKAVYRWLYLCRRVAELRSKGGAVDDIAHQLRVPRAAAAGLHEMSSHGS